jgi:hypothetical protein
MALQKRGKKSKGGGNKKSRVRKSEGFKRLGSVTGKTYSFEDMPLGPPRFL